MILIEFAAETGMWFSGTVVGYFCSPMAGHSKDHLAVFLCPLIIEGQKPSSPWSPSRSELLRCTPSVVPVENESP